MPYATQEVDLTQQEMFVKWRDLLHERYRQLDDRIGSAETFEELIEYLTVAKEAVTEQLKAVRQAADLSYTLRRAYIEQAEGKIRCLTKFILETRQMSTINASDVA